jgi:hypothetical protein
MRLKLAIGRNMRQATKDRFDLDPLDLDRESFPSIGDLTIGVLAEFFPLELNRPVEIVAKVIAPEDHGVIADIPIRFANRPAPSQHCIAPRCSGSTRTSPSVPWDVHGSAMAWSEDALRVDSRRAP